MRTADGPDAVKAAAAVHLSAAGQQQVTVALAVMSCLEDQLHALRRQLLDTARHMKGARVLTRDLYGAGPVTALALTCWLGGAGRFSSARKAVRFAGLDITVYSSDGKRTPGRLSRQGPPVLRWAVYEAGKTHARASAPDHAYYAQVKDRKNGKRAALSEARKIIRRACHILNDLGDDAFAA
jgi:transposase